MRRKIALAGAGLAAVASLAPLPAASAVCGPDLSRIGGPSCPSLCPGVVVRVVNEVAGDGFLACFA